jgi:hypothetical protein
VTSRAASIARVALFVASLAFMVLAWAFVLRSRSARMRTPVPPSSDERAEVPGLAGEIEIAGGARLLVRLARLHSDASRQEFDALALQRRFGLATGEPFACDLRYLGERDATRALPLDAIAVSDERGPALAAFARPAPATYVDPRATHVDPLATLLAPPDAKLQAGETVCIVLWGRDPTGAVRLTLEPGVEVALAPASLPKNQMETALARIETPRTTPSAVEER